MENNALSGGTGTKFRGGPSGACRNVNCHVLPGASEPYMDPTQ
jgi:hypothetical protein